MQYKNIIFDLGNVLVKLNPDGCIGAFKAIGMGELVDSNPQSEGMKLMSKLGVGMITTEEFCEAARKLTGTDVTNEEIINAANKMLVEIPDEKKERLLQLKKAGYRLFLLSNTIDVHWGYCVEHLFPYQNHGVEDYFEHCFLSQRMHLAKPDARIYEEVIRQANINPDETLFIDDLKENCEAAEKLGIHTFQNVKFDDWLALTFVR
ncbi:HAD family phosphatase [Prevotella copri]|uniref:HAD family hydrolase n=1 Tax=Segatella copri TaxID=165179 RepID=UPI002231E37B|nr:HAD family phosphatase [Segatella copri]MCW4119758.1 HAD family phosphatase [Segatella copri]